MMINLELLSDIEYPVTRDEIIQHAQGNGASTRVLFTLRGLPDVAYRSEEEVERNLQIVSRLRGIDEHAFDRERQ